MAAKLLKLSSVISNSGHGELEAVAGDPTASPPTYVEDLSSTETVIGEEDGYDLQNCDALRLFYDVLLEAPATYVELILVALAASPVRGGVAELSGVDSRFEPDIASLDDLNGVLVPKSSVLRFSASRRGMLTLPRPSLVVRFEVRTDSPTPGSKIALLAQPILSGSE